MITRRVSSPRPLSVSLSRFTSAVSVAAVLGLAAGSSKGANFNWDPTSTGTANGGGPGTWSTNPANLFWFNGAADVTWPNLADSVAIFGGTPGTGAVTINTGTGITANGLTFNVSGYTVSGNVLADVLNLAGTTPTITVSNAAATDTINAVLGGTAGFTKSGTGTLALGADNLATLSGAIALNQGRTTLTNLNALGAGTTTVGATGTLELNAGASANLGSSVVLDGGTLIHTPSNQVTVGGTTNLSVTNNGGTINIAAAGPGGKVFVNGGLISGPAGATLNKAGGGDLQLAGANPAMLSNVNVTGGQLELQNSSALGGAGGGSIAVGGTGEIVSSGAAIPNAITLNTGGTLSSNGNGGANYQGPITAAGNANVALRFFQSTGTPNNLTIGGTLSGSGNLNVTAPAPTSTAVSSLLLSGNNTAYTGTVTVNPNAQVRAIQGTGIDGLGASNVTLSGGTLGISPVITAAGATAGFQGRYYIGTNANQIASITSGVIGGYDFGLTATPGGTRTDTTINFADFTQAGQFPAGFAPAGNSNFGILWTGILNVTTGGAYTFSTTSDDGSLLYVDGQPVALNDFAQGATTRSGVINIPAGFHSVVAKYGQGGGGTSMVANYSGPDTGNVTALLGSGGTVTSNPTINSSTVLLGTSTIDNNIALAAGTTSAIDLAATAATNTGTLTFGAGSRLNVTGLTGSEVLTQQGNVTLSGANVLAAGNIQVAGNLQNQSSGADVVISGVIGEATAGSSLVKIGPRNLTLSATNTYTGLTSFTGGTLLTLSAAGGKSVPGNLLLNPYAISNIVMTARETANDQIADNAVVTLVGYSGIAGSNLDLNGFNDTIGSINFINNQGTGVETVSTGAGTLTLNGNVSFAGTSTGAQSITGNLNLGGATRTFTATGLGAPTIGAVVSNGGIIKAGLAPLTLSGANTYTGLTTINTGKLSVSNAAGLGTAGAGEGTVVNAGGYLDIVNVTTAEPITLNGRGQPNLANIAVNNYGLNFTGALQGSGGFLGVASGPITLASNSAVGAPAGNLLTISGVIADNGSAFSLTKTQGNNAALIGTGATTAGPGIVKLTAANTYTGATIVEAGDLWLAGAGQTLASTSVVIGTGTSDAALTAVGTNNQFAPNTILTFNGGSKNAKLQLNGTTQTVAGFNVSGSLAIIQNHESAAPGAGTLIVNNPADTSFNGLIRDQSNTLALTKQGAGTLTLSGNGVFGTGGAVYTGATTVSAGKLVVSDETGFNSPITLSGTGSMEFNYSLGRTLTYSKILTDGGLGFTKSGAGVLTLTGANVVTGPIQVTGGNLVVGGAIGASTIIPGAPINVSAGAQLNLFGGAGVSTYNNNVTLNGVTFGGALAGAVSGGVIDNTLSGTITLNSTSNVSTGWADKTFRMTGQITGAGGLQFDKLLYTQQPPVFQVTNTANDYAGGTRINAGTVYFTQGAFPSTGSLTFGGAFTQSSLNTLNGPNLVIGTNGLTGPFTRNVGTGAGQVAFTGEGGGFSAIGGTQTITFGGATPQTVDWGGAGFSSGAALWFNGSNTLGGGSAFNADSEVNVTNDFVLSGGGLRRIFVVDNNGSATDQVRFSGAISGPGGLLKDGGNSATPAAANIQGTLILSGATPNTYTGLTNVSAGVLRLNKTAGVTSIAGDLQIGGAQNNGTRRIVYLGADNQIADTATVSLIGSSANNGDLRLFGFNETVAAIQDRSGGGVIELADQGETPATAASTLTVSGSGNSFFNGFFRNFGGTSSGVLSLTKEGTGTLTLSAGQQSGNGSQNYSGATTINGGKVVFANIGTYASPITVNATGAGTGVEFLANVNQSLTENQVISGAGTLTKTGLGTIILSGANAYSGATSVDGGTLQITGTTAAGQTGTYTVNSGGTLLIGNGTTGGTLTANNNITVNSGGVVAFNRNGYTYSGVISGAGSVQNRAGGGTVILSGANTYTGTTTALTNTSLTLAGNGASAGGLIVNSGATLTLDFGQAGSNSAGIVAATTPVTLNGGSLVLNAAGANTQSLGAITVGPGVSTFARQGTGSVNIATGAFSHATGGVLLINATGVGGTATTTSTPVGGILAGFVVDNTLSTWFALSGGNLSPLTTYGADTYGAGVNTDVVAGGAGGTTNSLRFNTAAPRTVTLAGSATLASGGILVTPAVGNNANIITGGTLLGSATSGLTVIQGNSANTLTIGSVIADNGGATGLTKAGAGTLILTGANTYSGDTVVAQGTLISTGSLGTGLASALPGAVLQIGDGTTNGALPRFGVNSSSVVIANGAAQTLSAPFNAGVDFNFTAGAVNSPSSFQTGTFTKTGAGTLTITAPVLANQFHQRAGTTVIDTGANVFSNGFNSVGLNAGDTAILTVKGAGRITQSADFNVGDVSSLGTLNIQDQGVVTVGNFFAGKFGTGVGIVNQTFGSLVNSGGGADWRIGGGGGTGDVAAYGAYNLSAGSFQTARNFQIGAFGRGIFNQTGGTVSVTGGFPVVARFGGSVGELNIDNGTFTITGNRLIVAENGYGILNVSGGGQLINTATAAATGLGITNTTTGGINNGNTGIVNLLNGGLIQVAQVADVDGGANGLGIFNFNGGTLRVTGASAAGATFMQGLTSAVVQPGGAIIDTNNVATTIGQSLTAPTGQAVSAVAVGAGGSGYVGEPIIQLTGGTGTGATARAVVSGGVVTGFTVTNPGSGYTAGDVLAVNVVGGGGTGATGTVTLGAANVTGGLTKVNAGTLTLNSAQTYGGATTINGGGITLDYSAASAPTDNLLPATALNIGAASSGLGGALAITGKASIVNNQTFAGVNVNGVGSITATIGAGGTVNVNLGAITRNAGALNFTLPATGNIQTLSANTGTTILGGWATVGGANWAVSAGDGAVAGNITALGTYVADAWAAGNNTDVTIASTITGLTTNSVRFNTATPSTVTVSGVDTITTGGILITPTATAAATIFTGGTLNSGGATTDLVVNHFGTNNATIVSAIGNLTGGLVKAGTGTLILSAPAGTTAYTGSTNIGGGILRLGVTNQIPDASTVTIAAGASLDLNNLADTIGGLSGWGTVQNTVAGTPVLTVGTGNASSTFSGTIITGTGNVAITKVGTGTLTLNNVVAGTFTGGTTISAGAIKLATPAALANNTTITVNAANGLQFDTTVPTISALAGNSAISLQTLATSPLPNAPVQLSVGNNNAGATFSGALTGSGTLIKIGTGIETLSGANTNTGGLVVNGGVLALSGNNSGAGGSIFVNNGGTLQLNAVNSVYGATGQTIVVANGGIVSAQAFTANPTSTGIASLASLAIRVDPRSTGVVGLQVDNSLAAPITENLDFGAVGLNLSLGAVLNNTLGFGNAPVQYTGVITPNAGIFRVGGGNGRLILSNPATLAGANALNIGGGGSATGQLFLTAAYPYSGVTTINAGTTIVTNLKDGGAASSLGAASSAASNLVLNGGTLQYVGNGASTDRLFTLSTTPTAIDASGSAPVNFTNTGAVAFVNGGNRTLTLQGSNTGTNTLAAAIGDSLAITAANAGVSNGTTSLTKNGNGTWVLSGTNTFSGGITVNNGVLQFANAGAIGANTVNGPASVLVNGGGAAAFGSSFTGSIQTALNRISPLSTGSIALTANIAESINLDGGSNGATLPQVSLGAYGNVTYTGTLTPFGNSYRLGGGGGVLSMPNGGLTGPRQLIIGGGGPGTSLVNGPNLNGAVVLGGTSDYSGGTVLTTGGIVSATSLTALGTGPLKFQGGFYRAVNATDITLASDGVTARDIRIGNESSNNVQTANIDVVAGVNLILSKTFGALAPVGSNYGQETLTKFGPGTLTLANGVNLMNTNGSNTLASNSGTLTIERGTLTMLSNPTNFNGLIQVGSNSGGVGTLKLGANNVFANTTAQFGSASNIDVFTGSTIDLAGFSDTFRNIRSLGSIINTGAPGANLTVGTNNEVGVVGGNLVGNFTITKGGQVTNVFGTGATISGFEIWNTNNSQFTGKFVINAGSMRFRADGSLGASNEPFAADKITINNNAVMISAGGTNLVIGANHGITLGAGGGTLWNFGTAAMIVNSPITGSGPLTIADDVGAIFLTNNANNWTGGTTINNNNAVNRGVLAIGAGGATGSLPAGDVLFNSANAAATAGRLIFFKSTDTTVPNNINGPGVVMQIGAGTTTLTGNNTTNQTTVIGGGKLRADFTDPSKSPIGTGTALQLSAGTFEYVAPAGDNTFRFNQLTSTQFANNGLFAATVVGGGIGDSVVQSTYGGSGTQTLLFNGFARGTAGVTTNFITSGGVNGVTNSIRFQAGPALNAPIGAAYYFNGSEFASLDTNGFVRAINPGSDVNASALNTLAGGQYGKLTNPITAQAAISLPGINLSGGTAGLNMAAAAVLTLNGNPGALLKSGGGTSIVDGGAGASLSNNNQEIILRADTAADTLRIDLPMTGTGQLTKSGLGQVTLTAVNTATGNNLLSQGTLLVTGSGTLGTAASPTGEIRIANAAGQTATLAIDSATASITQANAANALRVGEMGTGIVNQTNGTVSVSNYLTIGESLGSSGTYNISGGTLNIKTNNGTPAAGTTGQNNMVVGRVGTGAVNISGNATVNVLNGAQVMLGMGTNNSNQYQGLVPNAGLSTGVGTITQTGGSVNVAVNNGTFQPNGVLGVVGGVIIGVDGSGTYSLNGGTLTTPILGRGHGTATFNLGSGTLKAATPVATLSAPLFNVDLPINLTGTGAGKGVIDTNGNDSTVSGPLSGTGGLAKAGAGTLSVIGNGTYAGGTDINTGKVVSSGTSLGTGVVSVAGGSTLEVQGVQQGLLARFYLTNTTGVTPGVTNGNAAFVDELSSLDNFNAFVSGKPMVAVESTTARGKVSLNYLDNGSGGQNSALPPALVQINNAQNFVGHLAGKFNATAAGDYTFQTRSDDATVIWIDGRPVLDNNRPQGSTTRTGTIDLTAGLHDIVIGYQQGGGGATLSVGVTQPGQGQSFQIGNELNMSNSLLSFGSNDLTVGGLSGSGAVKMAAGALKVLTGAGSNDFGGVITGSAGGSFVKEGAGTQILSGDSSATLTDPTIVNGGTLLVNGSIAGSSTTVNNGGTLGGSGTVGALTVASGGTVSPGTTIGDLTVASASFAAGSGLSLQLNGGTAGTGYDQLTVGSGGTVSLLGGNITLSLGFAPANNQQFMVIENLGSGAIAGTFSNLANGGIISATFGGTQYNFVANYSGGTGNDLILTVPEPTSATALLAGLTMAAGLRRFRRKD